MNLYIPIEFKNRELGPKLWLIKNYIDLERYNVIFGNTDVIISKILKGKIQPGVIILKSAQRYFFYKILFLKILGNFLILLEEEAWVPYNSRDLIRRRFPLRTLVLINKIWLPYVNIKKSFSKFKYYLLRNKIIVTGHPRINYFKQINVGLINNTNTNTNTNKILIISSFGYNTKLNVSIFLSSMKNELGYINFIKHKKKYKHFKEEVEKDYDFMLKLISYLNTKNFTIHYRPHPSEIIDSKSNFLNLLKIRRDNFTEIEKENYKYIIHFGSTFALDLLILGFLNVICVDRRNDPEILTNSKLSNCFITDLSYFNSDKKLTSIYCNSNFNDLMCEFSISDINFTHKVRNNFIKKIVNIFCQQFKFHVDHSKNNICLNDFINFNNFFENKLYFNDLGDNLFNIIYRSE